VLAKAASGALEAVDLVRVTNIARALEILKGAGFWCIGLDAAAPAPLSGTDLTGRTALVLGSEGRGLRRLVAKGCDGLATLPMSGPMESLNVSAAAAIALYEAARQREGR
jgi:23S rRNA (guanosine2251-2'-O)-methyltransferase